MWTELVQYSVVALMLDIREHVRFIDERVKNVKTDRAKSKDSHSSLLCSHSHFSLLVKYETPKYETPKYETPKYETPKRLVWTKTKNSVWLAKFVWNSLRAARKGFSRDEEWLRRLL